MLSRFQAASNSGAMPSAKAFDLLYALTRFGIDELRSPELTGTWEYKLKQMEHGELARDEFMQREIAVWDGNPEQQYSGEEMKKILEDALDSLKPDFRTVFTLRDIEALSTEETADALGISVAAVKSRLLRARLALREKLTRQFKRKGGNAFDYM